MGRDARTILVEAITLGDDDRAELATELIASLDEPTADSQEDVDRLWAIEIERRSRRLANGGSAGIPWGVVRAQVGRSLADTGVQTVPDSEPFDLWYDATTVDAHLVVETWIRHGPRADDATFDPQPGDWVTVGDDEEPSIRGRVTRRSDNKVWVRLELGLASVDAASRAVGHG